MLAGRNIGAEEADRIGLVLLVVPRRRVAGGRTRNGRSDRRQRPLGVRMTKEVMWSQEVGSLQAGIDLENRTQVLSSMTGDMQEAMTAFLEKRPARCGESGAGALLTHDDDTSGRPRS
jgi:enoyl-CoA hydratase